jgi:hypothetical protein
MSRITRNTFGIRVSLLAAFISVVAAVVPLVALAGDGNPYGV